MGATLSSTTEAPSEGGTSAQLTLEELGKLDADSLRRTAKRNPSVLLSSNGPGLLHEAIALQMHEAVACIADLAVQR
jgi:hypothetical protein